MKRLLFMAWVNDPDNLAAAAITSSQKDNDPASEAKPDA